MVFKETEFKLKDGRVALLRSPHEADAEEMLQFIIKASGETAFLMKYPEERQKPPLKLQQKLPPKQR